MKMRCWLLGFKKRVVSKRRSRLDGATAPRCFTLQPLEPRLTRATLLVNTASDAVDASTLSLRDAIVAVNAQSRAVLSATEQSQVSGTFGAGDTIRFDSTIFDAAQTITVGSTLPSLTNSVVVQGPGANLLTVDGNQMGSVLTINSGVVATIAGLTITGGSINSNASGGGINNAGTLTITSSTISGNLASVNCIGGGINNSGALTIISSTISGNLASAGSVGGGINNSGALTVTGSTISGNSASGSNGGGINNSGTLTITGSTISGNTALTGGGICNQSGAPILVNSLIANNTNGDIGGGNNVSTTNSKNNLIGSAGSAGGLTNGVNGNIVGVAANLGPLQNNGGPTQTMALLAGSPAIAAGIAVSGITTDQRKMLRDTVNPSIGAYEYNPGALVVTSAADSSTASGVTLREAVHYALFLGGSHTITFASSLTASGPVTITLVQTDDTTFGPSSLGIAANVTIEGATGTSGITLAGNGTARLFFIGTTGSLTLDNLTLSGGQARGFNGASGSGQGGGGGGAAGMGGAVFNQGALTLRNSTLSGNTARGGDGGAGGGFGGSGIGGGGGGGVIDAGQKSLDGTLTGGKGGSGGGGDGGKGSGTNLNTPGLPGTFGGGGGGGGYGGGVGNGAVGGTGGFGGGAGGSGGNTSFFTSGRFGGGRGGVSSIIGGGGGGGAGLGGAIFNDGGATLTIANSTLSGNTALGGAGGVTSKSKTSPPYPVTPTDGSAGSGYGGAIFSLNGSVTLTNATLAANTVAGGASASGGALYTLGKDGVVQFPGGPAVGSAAGAVVSIANSILANSNGGADYVDNGSTVSASHNLATQSSGLAAGVTSTTAAELGLVSTLASNGGPTQTLALLPGSLAIDVGSDAGATGITTDQRGTGYARIVGAHVDVGAYESEGFAISIEGGGTQSAAVGSEFVAPLAVKVTSNNPLLTNLVGGQVAFTAPSSGGSATLSTNPVALAADGTASTNATANGTVGGPYAVTATASGIATAASFQLINTSATTTSVTASAGTTIYGESVTFTAAVVAIAAGTFGNGGTVQFVIDGGNYGTPQSLDTLGKASITLATLDVAQSPHIVQAYYSGDTLFTASNGQLAGYSVAPATPIVSVIDAGGVYNGTPDAVTNATVTGIPTDGALVSFGDASLSYTFYSNGNPLGGAPKDVGSYTVVAHWTSKNTDYTSADSSAVPFDITAKPLTVSGLASGNKIYNGTTDATLTGTAALQTAEVAGTGSSDDGVPYTGDAVSLSGTATGTFASKDVGGGISVAVTGLSLAGAQANNYSLTPPAPNANITPATLTVTADHQSVIYLWDPPSLTYAITGYVNSENATTAGVTGSPQLDCTATNGSPAGGYAITVAVGNLAAPNYVFSPVEGTLSVITVTTTGIYNPASSQFYLSYRNDGTHVNGSFGFGIPGLGWLPLSGDWNADTVDTIGLYDPRDAHFYLRNSNTTGIADVNFGYGVPGSKWIPLAGDWDGDGVTSVGLYDPASSYFFLRNTNTAGAADYAFGCGVPGAGWLPVTGDWNHSGKDHVGLYDPTTGMFYLRNSQTTGIADIAFPYGSPGSNWIPLTGDWNGDGLQSAGFYQPGTASHFYLRNSSTAGMADVHFGFGFNGAKPIVGDWLGPIGTPLLAAGPKPTVPALSLADTQLQPIVSAAISRWAQQGVGAAALSSMQSVQVVLADLSGLRLGEVQPGLIRIDRDAAGRGWFFDSTPMDDVEFSNGRAIDAQTVDRIDLLTVVEHELGHIVGLSDLDSTADNLMSGQLGAGIRRAPGKAEVDRVFSASVHESL